MAKALIAAALALTLLAGCATAPRHLDGFIAYWCATNDPERPTAAEYALYTEDRKRDMNAHNTYGEKHCGWRA
jgi:hypothetical protein